VKITPEGKVKVLDFGLAKALESEPAQVNSNSPTMLSAAATNGAMILGTAGSMSPEQARGHAADQSSDIFRLAASCMRCSPAARHFPATTSQGSVIAFLAMTRGVVSKAASLKMSLWNHPVCASDASRDIPYWHSHPPKLRKGVWDALPCSKISLLYDSQTPITPNIRSFSVT
jgi:serine/threonine protein kinase